MKILLNIMMILSFIFLWINHPLAMALLIMMQTMAISIFVGLMMGSFWFSYIIMIIMLSGMLVLFTYMASIASNEKFKVSIKLILITMILFMMNMFMKINMEEFTTQDLSIILTQLFSSKSSIIIIMMVLYLLFTMIVVSKTANSNEGPLRAK
uniref:NADH dehydrogenase subunit 6 n=1 Tax=Ischnodemus noctulus TaxID=2969361 RepID=UPI002176B442|nr:NADH dehydrogenase subunit 6 [Ischnodemus noctulus]UUJ37787.1 NADH dehydrogenase subunit 6 [Ischnodemus noctulus]